MNRGRGRTVHSRGRSTPMRWSPRPQSPVVNDGLSSSYQWRVKDGEKSTQQTAGASFSDKLSSSHEREGGCCSKARCDLEQDVPDAAGSCSADRNHSVAVESVSAKDISSSSACSGSRDLHGKTDNGGIRNFGTLPTDLSVKLNISELHGNTELSLKPGVADGLAIKNSNITDSHETELMEQQALIDGFDICLTKQSGTVVLKPSLLAQNRERRNEMRRNSEAKNWTVLRPGMVLLKGYISLSDQVKIVKKCRDLGVSPGGFYQPGYREGTKLHLKMMCLGKNWDPQTSEYGDCRSFDGAKPPNIPVEFQQLVEKAIRDSHVLIEQDSKTKDPEKILPWMSSNICLVNFYSQNGRLGLHQDKNETEESLRLGLPVVSLSIGDSADFLYGDERDVDKAQKVVLQSGDVLIFGGKSRHIFHGVTAIHPNSAPKLLLEEASLRPGRLNLTFRQY